jgi:hypothetical protein
MFCAPQAVWKTPNHVLVQKILHNNVYWNDKINEIVNGLDSDGSSFSEVSDGDTCTVEYILITRNTKFIFDNHTHEHITQVTSAELLEFVSSYSHPICSFCLNVSGG